MTFFIHKRGKKRELLANQQDGSFFIRDSTNQDEGEYILTVKKGDSCKDIPFIQYKGKYFLLHSHMFSSVMEMVKFHQIVPLTDSSLENVTLAKPIFKR